MSDWQPIETAPKDVCWLLLFDGRVIMGGWDGDRWEDVGGFKLRPTHWMPLPDPPKN